MAGIGELGEGVEQATALLGRQRRGRIQPLGSSRYGAGVRACFTSTQPITPTITSQTSPHYAEALDWEYRDREHTLYPSQQ